MDDHTDTLTQARRAYEAHDWPTAAAHFDAVASDQFTADDLAAYSDAAWWLGRIEDTADPASMAEITKPITWIGGADSPAYFTESRALLREWLPTTTAVDVAGAGHYFPLLKPADTATAVHEWLRSQTTAR